MEKRQIKKNTFNQKYNRKYVKKQEDPVKLYEIDVILSRDGKSYRAYVPACTTQGVINGLNHIVDYMRQYHEIHFDVGVEPVV